MWHSSYCCSNFLAGCQQLTPSADGKHMLDGPQTNRGANTSTLCVYKFDMHITNVIGVGTKDRPGYQNFQLRLQRAEAGRGGKKAVECVA